MKGNVLDHKYKLTVAKLCLNDEKMKKLILRQDKHKNDIWKIQPILNHLIEEFGELNQAIKNKDFSNMLEEIADISNLCDILFMQILFGDD